jgi:signal transduction histidine kinase
VQEAINNIEKHAKAKSVKLQMRLDGDFVELKIQDDGQGFDPKTAHATKQSRHGLGLTNMRERALSLGGTCELHAKPGKGTSLSIRVPTVVPPKISGGKKERAGES